MGVEQALANAIRVFDGIGVPGKVLVWKMYYSCLDKFTCDELYDHGSTIESILQRPLRHQLRGRAEGGARRNTIDETKDDDSLR